MKRIEFGELLKNADIFTDGDWVESKDQDQNGSVRLIQLADIAENRFLNKSSRFLTEDKAIDLKCTFLQQGDLLIARMPDPIGRCCIYPGVEQKAVTVVDVCIVRAKSIPNIDIKWLMHCINSPTFRHQIKTYSTGTTRKRISRKNLGKITLNLPSLSEQKRIANILDKAEELRRKREESLALMDEFLKSVFLEMFGEENKWPKLTVEEIASQKPYSCVGGPFGSKLTSKDYVDKPGIPVIRGKNLGNNQQYFFEDDFVFVSESKAQSLSSNQAFKGDILMTQRGTLGQVGYIPKNAKFDKYIVSQSQMKLTPNLNIVNPIYLYWYMSSHHVQRILEKETIATGVPHINLTIFRKIEITLPPLELQNKFEAIANKLLKFKLKSSNNYAHITNLSKSLTQRAFRGEL